MPALGRRSIDVQFEREYCDARCPAFFLCPAIFLCPAFLRFGFSAAARRRLGADWQPAKGPLATRWAKDVAPDKAHPDYPRPQLVRSLWQNLNGLWQCELAEKALAAPPAEFHQQILVPFPVESALSGVMKPTRHVWYRRTFELPAAWRKSGCCCTSAPSIGKPRSG